MSAVVPSDYWAESARRYHLVIKFAVSGLIMKNAHLVIVAFAAVASSQSALAATQNLGVLTGAGSSFSDLSSTTTVAQGIRSLSDSLSFTLTEDLSSLSFTISGFQRLNPGDNWSDYSFTSLTGAGGGFSVAATNSGLVYSSTQALSAGTYSLTLSGTAASSPPILNGSVRYDVSYTAVASPVPEPETYALMLAGLGVVGWAARRRKLVAAAPAQALPA